MGTMTYFEKQVQDCGDMKGDRHVNLQVGTTGYATHGPQMFLKLGESEVILSHDDAKALCEKIEDIASYFGHWKEHG